MLEDESPGYSLLDQVEDSFASMTELIIMCKNHKIDGV
jgi:hypothetical protein